LCIGIDIHNDLLPKNFELEYFIKNMIDNTSDLVCSYKPNVAFFEKRGSEGVELLREIIAYIPKNIPVILDAKRGDIGSTAQAYAEAAFNYFAADAITLNPYFGLDSIQPFLEYKDKHIFVLCRTTNNSSDEIQNIVLQNSKKLFQEIALLANKWNRFDNIGLVVGATFPQEAKQIRDICKDMIFLVPGIGQQGGDTKEIIQAINTNSNLPKMIISSSRSIMYAGDNNEKDISQYMNDIRNAAQLINNQISQYDK
jgi:orotidine-5'-phosphate decarboxylase